MTSPLFSSAISPRKIISEGSETRSLAGGKLAQLVSKFEFLDAVSSVGNSPHEPILARRVQTFGTKSPATPSKSVDIKSRQKSVSERRNIFETANQQAGMNKVGLSLPNI
ncbi:hypothetical protein ACHAPD_000140 [Fusarium lateritium]